MASRAEEALQQSGSAAIATTSQAQQAGQREAAAEGLCPICLDTMDNKAFVDACFHAFCFVCIQQWAALTATCPLCNEPFERILHMVEADDDYTKYVVGSSGHQQRSEARQRVHSRSALQQSSSVVTAATSQVQRAGQQVAAAEGLCPICLDTMDNKAFVGACFHTFCFVCIQQWAALTATCPLCNEPFERILHTVEADNDYTKYVVGSSGHQQRNEARQRVRSRSPQRRYNLRTRPTNNELAAGRRRPARRQQQARHNAAPGHSNPSAP